ncbi:MAG: DEAD/DEAH box helicase [Sarcina sp.]
MKKRISEIITKVEIEEWINNDVITITAGTGAGKSFFIKNILYEYAKLRNQKILFLIHRTNCINQFKEEIIRDKKQDVIYIESYQKIENDIINNKNYLGDYDYIVCDEFHYFTSDASFNDKTDLSLYSILQQSAIKIFMSATAKNMENYLNYIFNGNIKKYELPITFNFIENLNFYNSDKTLDSIATEIINKGEKAIFFIQSSEKAYELHKKFEKNSIFNCSTSNNKYRYVKKQKIVDILKNEMFEENILITTTSMDAGVNIIDANVKHIICDITDVAVLTQCIGRKRIQSSDDKIKLYIKDISSGKLLLLKKANEKNIEVAEYLLNHGTIKLVKKYNRKLNDNKILYDVINENNTLEKNINTLAYLKVKENIFQFDLMLKEGKNGYKEYMRSYFQQSFYILIEKENKKNILESYLENNKNKVMLQRKDREELIEVINVRSNGRRLKKIEVLNGALKEHNISFRIVEFETSRIIEDKKNKYKNAWKIIKIE